MALESGSRLGPYEVVGLLGSGGMGEVYRARDPRLEREVAIKILTGEVVDSDRLRRFEREARAASALNHPNVLAVHDVGTHQGAPYVVSDLLEGQTLRVRLEGGALPVRKALEHALEIAHGLAAAHDKGIVHRDLKPDNVFITEDGRVKILDFGLAKLTRPGPPVPGGDERTATKPTEAGVVLGTVGYMSPEQVRGEGVDPRSDIFSLGAVLFEMLSGTRAFRRPSAAETMNAILKEDPPELSGTSRGISAGIARIVRRCLEKRAQDRFHSAHDLALALEAASSGLSGPSPEADGSAEAAPSVGSANHHKKRLLLALAAMVLVAVGLYWSLLRSPVPSPGDAITSVAVLPFENVGGDPDSEYLSDGVAETLINKLSRLPNLKVIARTTSFRFRGKDVDPRRVGRDLGVGAVVTGRVSLRGDTLVIGAELVDVGQGMQLWGERYSVRMGGIFSVEEDIAGDISRGLRLTLAPADESRLTQRHTKDLEAYRLYVFSRHEFSKYGVEGIRKALEYARQATERDPRYALAHVAVADAYNSHGNLGLLPYKEAYRAARTAATRALEIEDALPEGHTALATAALYGDWDWAAAKREFERAIELNPNSADAHRGYGDYLVLVGSSQEGVAALKRAVELDPLSPGRYFDLSYAYFHARQFDQALGELRKVSALDPGPAHAWYLAVILTEQQKYEEAIAEFRKLAQQGDFAGVLGHLGNAYARAGRAREARACLRELKKLLAGQDIGEYEVALIYAGLGEGGAAFEWLDKAYDKRDKGLVYLKVDPLLDPLRSDPRFQDLLRRMKFPS